MTHTLTSDLDTGYPALAAPALGHAPQLDNGISLHMGAVLRQPSNAVERVDVAAFIPIDAITTRNATAPPASASNPECITPGVAVVIEQMGDALLRIMSAGVRGRIENELSDIVAHTDVATVSPMPSASELIERVSASSAVEVTKSKKKRVTIIGLLPKQAGKLSADFHDCFDLRFWNDRVGNGMDELKSLVKTSDVIIEHTGHMGHRAEAIVKAAGVRPIRVGGCVSRISDKLTELFCTTSSA